MTRLDTDYLLYAMTHVARKGLIRADRKFAQEMERAARDRWFKPSPQQADRMSAVEARFYQDGGGA